MKQKINVKLYTMLTTLLLFCFCPIFDNIYVSANEVDDLENEEVVIEELLQEETKLVNNVSTGDLEMDEQNNNEVKMTNDNVLDEMSQEKDVIEEISNDENIKQPEKNDTENNIILNLSDFDVDPTGYLDSGPGIYEALLKAKEYGKEGKQTTLQFEKGTYTVKKENAQVREVHTSNTSSVDYPEKHIGILIEDTDNLLVEGADSDIVFEGDMMAFGIFQSNNIEINDLSWDFRTPTTSEMTVFDYDKEEGTVDYFIPEYFDYEVQGNNIIWKSEEDSTGENYWTERNEHRNYGISVKYPSKKMGRAYHSHMGPLHNVEEIEELDNGLVRVHYKGETSNIEPVKGMNYQLVSNAIRPTAGALIWESKDVTLKNVDISYMHGFGFLVQMAENITFDGINMVTQPETGKNTSSYADGIHVSGAKGYIKIINSFFNNTHDDPINIHGTFTRVEEQIDKNTLRLNYIHHQQGGFQQFYPGDKVIFYSRDTLESADHETEYTVKSVIGPTKDNLKSMVVEFEEEIPSYVIEKIGNEPKYVAENVTYTPEILIQNNKFTNVFTRNILVTSRKKVVIDGNYLDASTMPSTFFSNDSDEWYESGPIRDLEITNNIFNVRSIGRTWWKYQPAIYFHPVTKGGAFPDSKNPIHKNILIEGNTFYLESDGALRAESVENLRFVNNKILRLNPDIKLEIEALDSLNVGENTRVKLTKEANKIEKQSNLPGGPERNSGSVGNVLEFQASTGVVVEGNTYDNGLKLNVLIEDMEEDDFLINDDLTVLTKRANLEASDPVGQVFYVSKNPNVVTVDKDGIITAHSKGTAEVYCYTVWNDTVIKSNSIEVVVDDNSESEVVEDLQLDKYVYEINKEENTLKLTKEQKEIVGDRLTLISKNPKILDFNGVEPIINSTGIAEVEVDLDGLTTNIYVVVNNPNDQLKLSDKIGIENKNLNSKVDKDSIVILRSGGEDLWGSNNSLNNLVRISLEDINADDFSASIDMSGLPIRKDNSWDSSYFTLFKLNEDGTVDRDNYISVGKRAHADGFGTVVEVSQVGQEEATGTKEHNEVTDMTFAIRKEGKDVSLYYKNRQEFNKIATYDASFLGEKLALGIGGWGNTQANNKLTVSNLKLTNGDLQQLESSSVVSFMQEDITDVSIRNVTIEEVGDGSYKVSAEGANNLKIIVEKEGITRLLDNDISFKDVGTYKLYAVNKGENNKLYLAEPISYTVDSTKVLRTINGVPLYSDLTLTVPSDLDYLLYRKGAEHQVVEIANTDKIQLDGYEVNINKVAASDAEIVLVNTSLGEFDVNLDNQFIYTESPDQYLEIEVKANDSTKNLVVIVPDYNQEYKLDDNGKVKVPIYNGVNSFEIVATALDDINKDIYRLHVLRNHKIQPGVKNYLYKGEVLEVVDGLAYVEDLSLDKFELVPNAVNAKVTYDILSHEDDELNLRVRIQHEDKLSVEYVDLTLKEKNEEELKEYVDQATNIKVTLSGEDAKKDLNLVVKEVDKDSLKRIQALSQKEFTAYDIYFADETGEKYSMRNKAVVEIPTKKAVEGVVYVSLSDKTVEYLTYVVREDSVVFETNHFSVYAVIYESTDRKTQVLTVKAQEPSSFSKNKQTTNQTTIVDEREVEIVNKKVVSRNERKGDYRKLPETGEKNKKIVLAIFILLVGIGILFLNKGYRNFVLGKKY